MIIKNLTRKFVIQNGKNEKISLSDINPDFDCDQILEHYAPLYPQLTTAKIVDKGIVNGERLFEFQTIAGTKG